MSVAVVVVAAGSGTRVGAVVDGASVNKVLLALGDSTVLGHSVRAALAVGGLSHLVVVVRDGDEPAVEATLGPELAATGREALLVPGGVTRHESEWRALRSLATAIDAGEVDVVVVHDAARPLAPAALWQAAVSAAREHGGAVPAARLPAVLTTDLGVVDGDGDLVGVQTPQAFRAAPLLAAHRAADEAGTEATDTAAVFAWWAVTHDPGQRVVAVPSTSANLKITYAEDVAVAAAATD